MWSVTKGLQYRVGQHARIIEVLQSRPTEPHTILRSQAPVRAFGVVLTASQRLVYIRRFGEAFRLGSWGAQSHLMRWSPRLMDHFSELVQSFEGAKHPLTNFLFGLLHKRDLG